MRAQRAEAFDCGLQIADFEFVESLRSIKLK